MLALLLALALQDPVIQESDHDLAPGAAVTIRTVTGRVRLRGTDKSAAHVRTAKRGRDRDLVEIKVEADKDKLTIEARFPSRTRDIDIEIEIDVDVPRSAKTLAADVVSGSIEVKDARGDAKLSTVSGSVTLDGLHGDLAVVAISGDVRIARLAGEKASISLTSGTLEGSVELRDLDVASVSGRASLDVTPKGDSWSVKAKSVSGDLHLRFPAKAGAKIDLKTLSGALVSEFDLKDMKRSGRHDIDRSLLGTFGDGGGTVHASTISGDVKLGLMK